MRGVASTQGLAYVDLCPLTCGELPKSSRIALFVAPRSGRSTTERVVGVRDPNICALENFRLVERE